ncbi:ANTH domain-containing protein [bacterium]|nr:ANTH domain-containing protein [bacterium]
MQTQGTNIRRYSDYLLERARAYRDTRVDFVKNGPGRLKKLTIDKGLLRETETVQEQIRTLLRADVRRPSQYTIETLLMELDVGEP